MTTGTLQVSDFFASLDDTTAELLNLVSSTDAGTINAVPFENSWTAAELAVHVTKSNNAIIQALDMKGVRAERNPAKRVTELKMMFLDFTTKFTSPEFITPKQGVYEKGALMAGLKRSIEQLNDLRNKIDLTEIISLPAFGEITKLELLYFVLYHTHRHIHQLKNMLTILNTQGPGE